MTTVSMLWPNGGTDSVELYATPRKIQLGWTAEIAVHIDPEKRFKGDFMGPHFPWGVASQDEAPFDSLEEAKARGFARLADEGEFYIAFSYLYNTFRVPLIFYLGRPAWSRRLDPVADLEKCIGPIIRLHQAGVPVSIYLDSMLAYPEGTHDHKLDLNTANAIRGLGIPCGGEPKPQFSWADRKDTPIISGVNEWHSMGGLDPLKLIHKPTLIFRTPDVEGARRELAAGNSVAFQDYPSITAAEIKAGVGTIDRPLPGPGDSQC